MNEFKTEAFTGFEKQIGDARLPDKAITLAVTRWHRPTERSYRLLLHALMAWSQPLCRLGPGAFLLPALALARRFGAFRPARRVDAGFLRIRLTEPLHPL